MNQDIKYEEHFKIRASEIDFHQQATMPAICNLLQEVAGNHAQKLNFDITDLNKDKLTWVLHRLCVKMNRYPDWRETITIQTWPSSGDGLRAYRDFLILDSKGNKIGRSLSYWLMMDIQSRRPTRIPKEILAMAPKDTKHVLPVKDGHFPDIENPDTKQEFNVRKSDLDLNRHVNNVRYLDWALACLPDDIKISEVDIKFMSESVFGDSDISMLKTQSTDAKPIYFHQISRVSDQTILAKARSQ